MNAVRNIRNTSFREKIEKTSHPYLTTNPPLENNKKKNCPGCSGKLPHS